MPARTGGDMALQNLVSTSAWVLFLLVSTLRISLAAPGSPATTKLEATILTPDGKPAAGAEVVVATADFPAWPNVPLAERAKEPERYGNPARALAGPNGRFTVAVPADAGRLSLQHDSGYAELSPSEAAGSPQLTLQPWCTVKGVARLGPKPLANVEVRLGGFPYSNDAGRVYYSYGTTTDADGRYALRRVPAGLAKVTLWNKRNESTLERYVEAEPGKPATLDLGGNGRPVTGRLALNGTLDLANVENSGIREGRLNVATMFRLDIPSPDFAEQRTPAFQQLSAQQRDDAERNWRNTPDAIAVHVKQHRHDPRIQKDGSFRIEDVPPGTYMLHISVRRLERAGGTYKDTGSAGKTVVVPGPAPSDEPIDVGELSISDAL
jgi:hypothetical protein